MLEQDRLRFFGEFSCDGSFGRTGRSVRHPPDVDRQPALLSVAEISEKHFSTLETRTRISHIQSRTSRREREFLSPNLMLRDKTENNFLQSQASRRDRDLFFLISDYETRTRLGPREKINLILTRIFEIENYRYALLWFFTGVVSMR